MLAELPKLDSGASFFCFRVKVFEMDVILGFGSNIGQRKQTLEAAYRELQQELGTMKAVSSFVETEPWGFESKDKFLNSAAIFSTDKSCGQVLEVCNRVEAHLGRQRSQSDVGYASRTIDIDILFYGNEVIDTPRLKVPHPLLEKRDFVLRPLREIAPNFVHPTLNRSIDLLWLENQSRSLSGRIETPRFFLRYWEESDAERLFQIAKVPELGKNAGWEPHKSVEESLDIIRTVLTFPTSFAVCEKESSQIVGCAGFLPSASSYLDIPTTEAEIGYWVAKERWGQGIATETTKAVVELCFERLEYQRLWCTSFSGNLSSQRVQSKCGFKFLSSQDAAPKLREPSDNITISTLSRADWLRCNA